jgi:RhtB (resistance to homoserine/threonine) family protein
VFITEFITVAIVHALAVMSPGPDFAMVTRNSLLYTRRTGILTALGISLGIAVHVAYSLLGIGLVISRSILAFSIIKYLGAAYLIYMGYQSIRASRLNSNSQNKDTQTVTQPYEMSTMASIRTGFLTNLLNPKATLFFLALFTQVIDPNTPKHIQALYGFEMMIITLVWFMLLALFFSNTTIRKRILRVQHLIERATGLVFILLGIKVALTTHE